MPVVNDLVVNHGWYIVGYAINHALYSDIASNVDVPGVASFDESPPDVAERATGAKAMNEQYKGMVTVCSDRCSLAMKSLRLATWRMD